MTDFDNDSYTDPYTNDSYHSCEGDEDLLVKSDWDSSNQTNSARSSKRTSEDALENSVEVPEFTVEELINKIGVGKWQILFVSVLALNNLSENVAIQCQPYLSARLYVDMELTPHLQGILGAASLAGFSVSNASWGFVADQIGKKNALLLCCLVVIVFNLLTCVAPNVYWIVVCRVGVSLTSGEISQYNFFSRNHFDNVFGSVQIKYKIAKIWSK